MKWYDDPKHICTRIKDAEQARDLRAERLKPRELASMGLHNVEDESVDPSVENLGLAVYTLLLPSMVTASPACRISSTGGHLERVEAAGVAAATSQISNKQRMHEQLEACAWDWFFKPYAAAFIEKAPANMADRTKGEQDAARGRLRPGEPDDVGGEAGDAKSPRANDMPRVQSPARWPRIKALDPARCGFDSSGRTIAEARFTWHETVEDYEMLRQRAIENPDDWILSGVESMPRCNRSGERLDSDSGGYVRYYVVYIPGGVLIDQDPKPDEHGVIYTLAAQHDSSGGVAGAIEVREPYYWTGIPTGPHIFEGQYTTGVDAFPMTLLGGNDESLVMLEATMQSLHQRIRDHKTVYPYDSAYEAEVQPLIKAKNGAYVPVPGLRDGVIQQHETSTVSPAEIAETREMRAAAGRGVGIDEAGRGQAQSGATATAVSRAASSADTKIEYLLNRWKRFPQKCIEALAWEVGHDGNIIMVLDSGGREAEVRARFEGPAKQLGLGREYVERLIETQKAERIEFAGGGFAGESSFDWNNLDIQLEPHSMDGTSGEMALMREMRWNEALAFLGDVAVRQPHVRWSDRIRATGRALGMTDAEAIFDPDVASQVAQVQIMGQSPEAMAQPGGGEKVRHHTAGGPSRQGESPASSFGGGA